MVGKRFGFYQAGFLLPAPPLNNWVALGRSLHLSELQLLNQYDEDKRRLNLVSSWVSRSRP